MALIDLEELGRSFEKFDLVITETKPQSIKSVQDSRVVFNDFPVKKGDVSVFISAAAQATVEAGNKASFIFNIFSIILMILSISMAVAMIRLFQRVYVLLFINVRLPSNATQFIFSFRNNALDYVPHIIRIGNDGRSSQEGLGEGTSNGLRLLVQRLI